MWPLPGSANNICAIGEFPENQYGEVTHYERQEKGDRIEQPVVPV